MPLTTAQKQVPFRIRQPKDPNGLPQIETVVVAPLDGSPGVRMWNSDFEMAQYHESSDASAAAKMLADLPTGQFDSRFMEHVQVGGVDAIAWDKIDTGPVPGVKVPFSGIVFRIGSDWFSIDSLGGKIDRNGMVQMAQGMSAAQ